MNQHRFQLTAHWNGGLKGAGEISTGHLRSIVSVPAEMAGPGEGTNPEEMLLGAAATCYLITLSAILERRKLPIERIELTSEGLVESAGGVKFKQIIHRPRLALPAQISDDERRGVEAAVELAEKACMVSNAIRNNVTVSVEPELVAG